MKALVVIWLYCLPLHTHRLPERSTTWRLVLLCRDGHLLLHPLSTPCVPEAFCKRVVVDLQLRHLLVLICCHRYELALLQISPFFSLSLDIFYRTIIWAFGKTWVGLPWRRMSWRWSREAEGCRSPSPGGTGAGTCASSSGSSATGEFRQNQLPQSSASHKFCRFRIDLGEKALTGELQLRELDSLEKSWTR